jgi:hypothetical protein
VTPVARVNLTITLQFSISAIRVRNVGRIPGRAKERAKVLRGTKKAAAVGVAHQRTMGAGDRARTDDILLGKRTIHTHRYPQRAPTSTN